MPAAELARVRLRRLWEEGRAHPELIWLTAIVAVGGAARFATLGHQSFDSGETVTAARIIHPSYAATFHAYSTIERSGPLYYTLAWGWSRLFGLGEVGLRSLSAIFGTATIVVAYLAGRELFSRRAGLIAAVLAAAGPDLFWYSQEARSYPLFIFLVGLGIYFFARALRRRSTGNLVGWGVASALALCTHYFAAFPIGVEALWLLAVERRDGGGLRRLRRPLLAIGAVLAVGLALLPLAIEQEGTGRRNSFKTVPVLERGTTSLVKFMIGEGGSTSGKWGPIPVPGRVAGLLALTVCAAAIVLLLARLRGPARRRVGAVAAVAVLAFIVPLALALAGVDYVEPRNLLSSLLPILVLTAGGLEVAGRALWKARGGAARLRLAPAVALTAAFCAVLALITWNPQFQRDNWRGLSKLVDQRGQVGVLLTQPSSAGKPLDYYLSDPLPRLAPPKFPCGVRTRRIVILSRTRPEPVTGPFGLVSYQETTQHWIVAIYAARRPHRLDAPELQGLDILGVGEEARVVEARKVEPRPLGERFVLHRGGSPWRGTFGTRAAGPGPCVGYQGAIKLQSS
jgi:mannosyltransferase